MKKITLKREFWVVLAVVILLAMLLASLDGREAWFRGWVAYLVLLGAGALGIYATWRAVSAERVAGMAALTAFGLRLGIGVILALLLPAVGYVTSIEHQAGYVYTDAYIRDNQAWELAISTKPVSDAFSGRYSGDQYGGMLATSAYLYRTLSPDAHRPLLPLIMGATLSAIGVLCLWKATQAWLDERSALLVAWMFTLYTESVLLGSSQMREGIVIPATAIAFYGLSEVLARRRGGWLWLAAAAIMLFFIQPLAGFISFAILAGIWLLDPSTLRASRLRQTIPVIFLVVASLLVVMLLVSSILASLPSVQGSGALGAFLTWFENNFTYQSYLTERASGMFQSLLDSLGEQWRWLIVVVYGVAQPVLPAIVGDPDAAWIMRIIGFLRAAGWYALALFLVYGTLGVIRSRGEPHRLQLAWISLASLAWIVLAALNAGADQWDNPRYRVILLLWQVMLAGWACQQARTRRDAWLWRWLAVEAVFVAMFTEWYLGRYYAGFPHLDIRWMMLITLLLSGAILIAGLVWDKTHRIRSNKRQ
jgi:hypothetical protein